MLIKNKMKIKIQGHDSIGFDKNIGRDHIGFKTWEVKFIKTLNQL